MTTAGVAPPKPPGLWRRLAAMAYEGVLLFGVLMVAGALYSIVTQQRHALHGRLGLQAFLFVVLGLYFVWFWTHGGQTLAAKTWRLRIETVAGRPLSRPRALARYLLSWLWFAPGLVVVRLAELHTGPAIAAVVGVGALSYAAASTLHPHRQFLHDALCGTRIVDVRATPPRH